MNPFRRFGRRSLSKEKKRRARRRTGKRMPGFEQLEQRQLLATYAVNTTLDVVDPSDSLLSLREAVIAANATAEADTIRLEAGDYKLTRAGQDEDNSRAGDLDIAGNVYIEGAGAGATNILGDGSDRVLHLLPGANAQVSRVTIRGGDATTGGGILNQGELRLTDAAVVGNTATDGAGIYNEGDLTVNDGALSQNTAANQGGALYTTQSAFLVGVTIEDNVAQEGAAYFNKITTDASEPAGGLVQFVNPTLRNNQAAGNLAGIRATFNQLLDDHADEFIAGVDDVYGLLASRLEEVVHSVDVPLLGDRIAEVFQPVVDGFETVRIATRERLDSVFENPGQADLYQLVQQAYFAVLGPSGLNLLLDGPDSGNDVGPTDVTATLGEDGRGKRWAQFNMHLSQGIIRDVPNFKLELDKLAALAKGQQAPGFEEGEIPESLKNFFNTFGFEIDANNGIRANLEWEVRLGLGVSEVVGQEFFIQAHTTRTGRDDGPKVEEFRALVDVFTAPSSENVTSFRTLFNENPGLTAAASLGLLQAKIQDGTPAIIKITAPDGLPAGLIAPHNFANEITITIDDEAPRTIQYESPVDLDTIPTLVANLNAALVAEFKTPLPPISFTLDFTRINRFFNSEDAPTTPSLVLNARDPNIRFLKIEGAEEWGFATDQVEDRRAFGLGFGNNKASQPATDGSGNQVLLADREAPGDGRLIDKLKFSLYVGGNRVTNPTPTTDIDRMITVGAERIGVSVSELLHRDIRSQEDLRKLVEEFIQNAVEASTPFRGGQVTLELVENRFQLTARRGADGSPAPLLTITYPVVDQTRLQLVGGLDITDPDFDDANRVLRPRDQRFFERALISDLARPLEVFSPVFKAKAKARFHVDAGAENIVDFAEQNMGLAQDSLGLPSVSFDFVFDAGIDFVDVISSKISGDSGNQGSGEQQSSPFDTFKIDTLQFANITLNIEEFLQTVVVPVIQSTAGAIEPFFGVLGNAAGNSDSLVNARLPVISDILNRRITLRSIFGDRALDGFFDFVGAVSNIGGTVSEFLKSSEFVSQTDDKGRFVFGGLELVMDPKSPFYFPKTRVPVPVDLKNYLEIGDAVGLDDFMNAFIGSEIRPDLFQIDLFRPQQIFNLILGEPIDIVSVGLPLVNIDAGADFGFNFNELAFNVKGLVQIDSNLRIVYDSLGLERIVSALRQGASPDPQDLLDGFHLRNNPYGFELGVVVDFEGGGSINLPVFEGGGFVDVHADLGLELFDPNNDGKLRLDEIFDITNNFHDPQHLACLFDISGGATVNVSGYARIPGTPDIDTPLGTIPGTPDINFSVDEIGLIGGSFSLIDILQNATGARFCSGLQAQIESHPPILAQVVEQNGEHVLRINTGPMAGARLYGDTTDADATAGLTVSAHQDGPDIVVTVHDPLSSALNNRTQRFPAAGIKRVVATGSPYDDVYDFSGLDVPVEFRGSSGHDIVTGGSADDWLEGGLGDDVISGGSGNDNLLGGGGNDALNGDAGADTIEGGGGDDQLQGGSGDDFLNGGRGKDVADGGAGNDTIDGGAGDDVLRGGADDDTIHGAGGNDTLYGESGNDQLDGGRGDDVVHGGSGNDSLRSPSGSNILRGDEGDDFIQGGTDDDVIDGGSGDDILLGGKGSDDISGGAGRDTLDGEAGDDVLRAGFGDLDVRGGNGVDDLHFDDGAATLGLHGVLSDNAISATRQLGPTLVTTVRDMERRRILLGSGDDDFTLSGTFAGTTALDTGAGLDQLTIQYAGADLFVHAGFSGEDNISVRQVRGATDIVTSGADLMVTAANTEDRVDTIAGPLFVQGARDTNTSLHVRETNVTESRTVTLDGQSVQGLDLPGSIRFANLSHFDLFLGAGNDLLIAKVNATGAAHVTVDGGLGDDVFDISGIVAGTLSFTARGGAGNDTMQIHDLEALPGQVIFAGDAGEDELDVTLVGSPSTLPTAAGVTTYDVEKIRFSNENNLQPAYWLLDQSRLTTGARNVITSFDAQHTELQLGAGHDSLAIQQVNHETVVDARQGADAITVGGLRGTTNVNLSHIGAPLRLAGGLDADVDTLTLDDTRRVDASETRIGEIDAGLVTGFGLADAIHYQNFSNLVTKLSLAQDHVTIRNTSAATTLDTGDSADTVTIVGVAHPTHVQLGQGADDLRITGADDIVTVDGGSGGATVTVDRSQAETGLAGSISSPAADTLRVSDLVNGAIEIAASTITQLNVVLGRGNDVVEIDSQAINAVIDVAGGDSDDRLQVHRVGGPTTFSGQAGEDTVEVIIPGDPTLSDFQLLGASAEQLIVANNVIQNPYSGDVAWRHEDDRILASHKPLLSTAGFDRVEIRGGSGTNALEIVRDIATNVEATIDNNHVELVDGVEVLRFDAHNAAIGDVVPLDGLEGATDIAASSDGQFLYTAAADDDAIVVFRRRAANEPLEYVQTVRIADADFRAITISADDQHVYAGGGQTEGSIYRFARNVSTGRLTLVDTVHDGLADAVPTDLVASANFSQVYVTATGTTDVVLVYDRDLTGHLQLVQTLQGAIVPAKPSSLAVSADGNHAYVLGDGLLAKYARDVNSGALTFLFSVDESALDIGHTNAGRIHPNNRFAYLVNEERELQVFSRDVVSGRLARVEQVHSFGSWSQAPLALSFSPQADNLYVLMPKTLAVFSVDPASGLVQLQQSLSVGFPSAADVSVSRDGQRVRVVGSRSTSGIMAAWDRATDGTLTNRDLVFNDFEDHVTDIAESGVSDDFYLGVRRDPIPETHVFVAGYRSSFQGVTPPPGWRYLSNDVAAIGDVANYVPMKWDASRSRYVQGDSQLTEGLATNRLGYFSSTGLKPGLAAGEDAGGHNPFNRDQYVIAEYAIPENGSYRLDNLTIGGFLNNNATIDQSVEVRVYIGASTTPTFQRVIFESQTPAIFDVDLGTRPAGEKIYVAIGPHTAEVEGNAADEVTFDFAVRRIVPAQPAVHTVQIWRNDAPIDTETLPTAGFLHDIVATPASASLSQDFVAVGQESGVRIYSREASNGTLNPKQDFPHDVRDLEFSPDGQYVYGAVGSGQHAVVVYQLAQELPSNSNSAPQFTFQIKVHQLISLNALGGVRPTQLSADEDGRFITAFSDSTQSLAILERNADGTLSVIATQTNGDNGAKLTNGADLVVLDDTDTPGTEHLYVAANGSLQAFTARDALRGLLLQQVIPVAPVHSLAIDKAERFLYASSMSGKLVSWFERNPLTGNLTSTNNNDISFSGAAGLVVVPNAVTGPFVYAVGSDQNAIAAFDQDAATGALTTDQVLTEGDLVELSIQGLQSVVKSPTSDLLFGVSPVDNALVVLDEGLVQRQLLIDGIGGVTGLDAAAAVVVSPDGRQLYVATRTGISIFGVDANNYAAPVGHVRTISNITGLVRPQSVAISPDGAHVYVGGEAGLTRLVRDANTGDLSDAITLPHDPVAALQIAADGSRLFAVDDVNGRLIILNRQAATGLLTAAQTLVSAPDLPLGGARGLAVTADAQLIYVAASSENALAIVRFNPATGLYEAFGAAREGQLGVRGLVGANAVAMADTADNRLLFVSGAAGDAVVVFERDANSGALTYRQTLRNQLAGVHGLESPNSIAVADASVYVGSSFGIGIDNGGVAKFSNLAFDAPLPEPAHLHITFSGMKHLGVITGVGSDVIQVVNGSAADTTSIVSQAGFDRVTLLQLSGDTFVNAGDDDDEIHIRSSAPGTILNVDAGPGSDTIDVQRAGEYARLFLHGGTDNDRFLVAGGSLPQTSVTNIQGQDHLAGDRLIFDPAGRDLPNGNPGPSSGTILAKGRGDVVYATIEDVQVIAAPIADAGGDYSIVEGQNVTLDASGTDELGDPAVSYAWDLNGDGLFDEYHGKLANLTWNELFALGLNDGSTSGSDYLVAVRATNSQGFSATAISTLTIVNTGPQISVSGTSPVGAGLPASIQFSATDPGEDRIRSWRVDWNDGSPVEELGSSASGASHRFAVPGSYAVKVEATDDDGTFAAMPFLVNVVNVAPTIDNLIVPETGVEGSPILVSATASDSPGDKLFFDWQVLRDGEQFAASSDSTFTFTPNDQGSYQIRLTVTDALGAAAPVQVRTINVTNAAPTILVATSESPAFEGTPTRLSVTASDPAGAHDPLVYEFDFDRDGVVDVTSDTGVIDHVFADDGRYEIAVRVRDGDGGAAQTTMSLAVDNVAPSQVAISGPATVNEGSNYVLTLGPVNGDPGDDTISRWTINWGDGSVQQIAGNPGTATHVYADDGRYEITATVSDEDGIYPANVVVVDVANVSPSLLISGPTDVSEGEYTLELFSSDPGADSISGWTIDWGDGSVVEHVAGRPSSRTHVYDGDGNYTITATARDEDGQYVAPEHSIFVANVAPTFVNAVVLTPNPLEARPLVLSANATDRAGALDRLSYQFDFDNDGAFDASSQDGLAQHTYPDDGIFPVRVRVADDDGAHRDTIINVSVQNIEPTVMIGGPSVAREGDTYTLDLSFVDPGDDTISGYRIDWGDGLVDELNFAHGPNRHPTHVYADGDAALIHEFTQNADIDVSVSGEFTLDLSSLDAAENITFWSVNWGDGSDVATYSGNTQQAQHTYAQSGEFTIIATSTRLTTRTITIQKLQDEDGEYQVSQSVNISVVDVSPNIELFGKPTQSIARAYELTLGDLTDPGVDTVKAFSVLWGDNTSMNFDRAPVSGEIITHFYSDVGEKTIQVFLEDEDGRHVAANRLTVEVLPNTPPHAEAGGPYRVLEGAQVLLDASGTTDAEQASSTLTYAWDFDADGIFGETGAAAARGDEVGIAPAFDAAGLDGPNNTTVRLRVTDEGGFVDEDEASIEIRNALPQIESIQSTATLQNKARRHQAVTVSGTFNDAGTLDTHTAVIDWGDGTQTVVEIDPGSRAFAGEHTYSDGGIYVVTVTLTDDDGGASSATTAAYVTGVRLTKDGELQIVGTSGKDLVLVKHVGAGRDNDDDDDDDDDDEDDDDDDNKQRGNGKQQLRVIAKFDVKRGEDDLDDDDDDDEDDDDDDPKSGREMFTFEMRSVHNIHVVLCDGDDHIKLHRDLLLDAMIDGGAGDDRIVGGGGNDTLIGGLGADVLRGRDGDDVLLGDDGDDRLRGGRGNDALVGGGGDDQLRGSSGRDVLIGGLGSDDLSGGKHDDILIGGSTSFDEQAAALRLLLATWTSADDYSTRIDHLRNGTGPILDGTGVKLSSSGGAITVIDDHAKDKLKGDSGRDWFFASLGGSDGDKLKDRKKDEWLDLLGG